jgi:hypothetical protein
MKFQMLSGSAAGSCRARVAHEFMRCTDAFLDGGLQPLRTHFVTFHAPRDTFTDPSGSAFLAAEAASDDKTYLTVGPGGDVEVSTRGIGLMASIESARACAFFVVLRLSTLFVNVLLRLLWICRRICGMRWQQNPDERSSLRELVSGSSRGCHDRGR